MWDAARYGTVLCHYIGNSALHLLRRGFCTLVLFIIIIGYNIIILQVSKVIAFMNI